MQKRQYSEYQHFLCQFLKLQFPLDSEKRARWHWQMHLVVLQEKNPGWREPEYFIVVKASWNLREALCSFHWTGSEPVLCANADTISTSQGCLQTSLLLHRETVPSKSLHCTNTPKYSLQNRQLVLFSHQVRRMWETYKNFYSNNYT